MNHSESVWDRYRPGYVDPLYVPYLRTPVKDPKGNIIPLNTWKKIGYSNGMVNPDIVRINWGLSFARKHGGDPCPPGFISGDGGFCFPLQPENEPVFYTKKAFIPKNQYFKSYTTSPYEPPHGGPTPIYTVDKNKSSSESFDMRSISPFTGHYTIFYEGPSSSSYSGNKNTKSTTKYGRNPTSDSYT